MLVCKGASGVRCCDGIIIIIAPLFQYLRKKQRMYYIDSVKELESTSSCSEFHTNDFYYMDAAFEPKHSHSLTR